MTHCNTFIQSKFVLQNFKHIYNNWFYQNIIDLTVVKRLVEFGAPSDSCYRHCMLVQSSKKLLYTRSWTNFTLWLHYKCWQIDLNSKNHTECTKTHHFEICNRKIFWGGGTAPSPDPSPSGEGKTPSPHPSLLGAYGASILTPSAFDLGAFGTSINGPPNVE